MQTNERRNEGLYELVWYMIFVSWIGQVPNKQVTLRPVPSYSKSKARVTYRCQCHLSPFFYLLIFFICNLIKLNHSLIISINLI